MKTLVALLALAGCGTPPARPISNAAAVEAPRPSRRLELVEGTPLRLGDGLTVDVAHIGYAHLTGSRNVSNCTLIVIRDGERLEVGLVREHGGPGPKVLPGDAHGWRFTLELADPYQQPGRVVVEAQEL